MAEPKYTRVCLVAECGNKHHAKDLCLKHYNITDSRRLGAKLYRSKNSEKIAKRKRQWEVANKTHRQLYMRKYMLTYRILNVPRRRGTVEYSIKKYGNIPKSLISNYDSRICGICRLKIKSKYEIDHIIPIARNGTHVVENLQLTHPICNRTKGKRLQKEMQLDIIILRELVGINS